MLNKSDSIIHYVLRITAALFLCLMVYLVLLQSGVAASIGFQLHYDVLFVSFIFGVIFYSLSRLPSRFSMLGLVMLSTTICGMVLSSMWVEAISDLSVMVGLFPYADASSYMEDAFRLLHGQELSGFSSRRPLSPGFWSVLLFLCDGNFKFALAAMVFITALSMVLPVREVVKTHGWLAGYVMFLSLFLFYRRIIGTTLGEHLGLMLGCIGFAYMWRSVRFDQKSFALAGVFILSLALNARSGAFFILPVLAIWAGFAWRDQLRFSIKMFVYMCLALSCGFVMNTIVLRTIGQSGANQGNFSYILYGLAHGGDWAHVYQDIPELQSMSEQERNSAIYTLARKEIIKKPLRLVVGVCRTYQYFFFSSEGCFSFVNFALQKSLIQSDLPPSMQKIISTQGAAGVLMEVCRNPWKYIHIMATLIMFGFLSVLSLLGLYALLKCRTSVHNLLMFSGLGILASVPFAPPWHADMMRAYAVTIPMAGAFAAIGAAALLTVMKRGSISTSSTTVKLTAQNVVTEPALFVVILVLLVGLAPISIKTFHPLLEQVDVPQALWRLKLVPGSIVSLAEVRTNSAWGSTVKLSDVHNNVGVFSSVYQEQSNVSQILAFTSDQVLAMGYETQANTVRYLVIDRAYFQRCGTGSFLADAEPILPDLPYVRWWKIRPASR
ncbi:MAG: hypothetical protein A2283_05890 [Lentisphaerae bacterium RIFOXYA12_FULL_48_11]|nr:MAG: hypothetical protein A2283_05890 [Lentisphaerae bacterium RIFOXYA12_FULL_48_11]